MLSNDLEKGLGISIYPNQDSINKDLKYLSLAYECGFKYLFLNFVKFNDEIFELNKKIIEKANELGFIISVDVAVDLIKSKSNEELSRFLKKLENVGIQIIRVDDGVNGEQESRILEFGNQLVELNASTPSPTLENLLKKFNSNRIITCHNFYPLEYTGLSLVFFNQQNCNLIKNNINIATFITLNKKDNLKGAWDEGNIAPTLEDHRNASLLFQLKQFLKNEYIKRFYISNCYANKKELQSLSRIINEELVLNLVMREKITKNEYDLLFNANHMVRGDLSKYLLRSTMGRITHKHLSFPANVLRKKLLKKEYKDSKDSVLGSKSPFNKVSKHCLYYSKGDVLLINDLFGRYKGEIQVVLFNNKVLYSHKKNLVGRVTKEDISLLNELRPWMKLKFLPLNKD